MIRKGYSYHNCQCHHLQSVFPFSFFLIVNFSFYHDTLQTRFCTYMYCWLKYIYSQWLMIKCFQFYLVPYIAEISRVLTQVIGKYCSNIGETIYHILTHWGRVTPICVSKITIIGSDNGLSPCRRQAIICTNAEILLIRPLATNFSEISIKFIYFHLLENVVWQMAAMLSQPQCVNSCSMYQTAMSLIDVVQTPIFTNTWTTSEYVLWYQWQFDIYTYLQFLCLIGITDLATVTHNFVAKSVPISMIDFSLVVVGYACLPQRNKTAVVLSVYWNNKHTSTKKTKHLARLRRSCAAVPGVRGAGLHDTATQGVPMIKIRPRPALLKSTYLN